MAHTTFGELPDPLMHITTSPGSAKFFNCSANTQSYPTSFEYAVSVGNESVSALHDIARKVRGSGCAAAISAHEDVFSICAGIFKPFDRFADHGGVDAIDGCEQLRLILIREIHTKKKSIALEIYSFNSLRLTTASRNPCSSRNSLV